MDRIDGLKVTFLNNLDIAEKFRRNKGFNFEDIDKSCLVEKLKLNDDWFTKSDLVILRVGSSCKILKSRY